MPGCYIQANNGIEIGRNIRIGPHVSIISANHNIDDFDKHDKAPPIVLGDNCWLGAGCIILPGVILGDHVIVAAGAVVTKSFADNCIIGGVPAKVIREIGPYKGKTDW
jgi:acetyltransferase-like isoleucine patch superfamily enzyme